MVLFLKKYSSSILFAATLISSVFVLEILEFPISAFLLTAVIETVLYISFLHYIDKKQTKKRIFTPYLNPNPSMQGKYAETFFFTQAINKMIMSISESDSVSHILMQMTSILGKTLQVDRSLIYDIDFKKDQAEGMCEWLNPDLPELSPSIGIFPLELFHASAVHILKNKTYIESHAGRVNPIMTEDNSAELLHNQMKIKSLLWFPFYYTDDRFYLLAFNQVSNERTWSSSEIEFLSAAANQITIAIQKISLLRELYREKEQAQVTLKSIGDAVITTDINGYIKFMNPIGEKLTGWVSNESMDKHYSQIFSIFDESTGEPAFYSIEECLHEGKIIALSNHTILKQKNGVEIPIENSAAPIKNNEGSIIGSVLVFHDVMDARKLKKQLEWQASHDPLTELYNRREFENRLRELIETDHSGNHCLLYLDLDQFKIVNDTCGHSAGDSLLKQISPLIQNTISENDIFARLGGDEFGIILLNSDTEKAVINAEKILKAINSYRFLENDKLFEIGASIGIVQITELDKNIFSILSNADMACYAAKEMGRNRYYVFEENTRDMKQKHREMEWVSRINLAFEKHHFMLYSQKIIPVSKDNGHSEHYEILLRLKEDDEKIITPSAFLPSAERYNLVQDLDRWVIDSAFSQLAKFKNKITEKQMVFSINLSGMSVSNDHLVDFIKEKLKYYQIPTANICFELTETAAIANLGKVHNLMLELKNLGIQFALDDFGSGLSSFAYLKHLPVDFLKIDGNFVSEILNNSVDRAMVESINQIGHVMKLKTIAEFVVEDEILDELRKIGVDYAQGFAIEKPRPLAEVFS